MVKNKKKINKNNKNDKNNKNVKKMELIKKRLIGSRFRYINEKLYKNNSEMSWNLFNNDPKLYTIYHEGYRNQIIKWPYNPINKIISWLNKHKEYFNIGDFGCGDALIAKTFKNRRVYSYDLISTNEYVIACNIKNVPLENNILDVSIFCLSLMGLDWPLFILESTRCTKLHGILKIVEITSRLINITEFIKFINSFGYIIQQFIHNEEDYFIFFEFKLEKKNEMDKNKLLQFNYLLNPCLYKQR